MGRGPVPAHESYPDCDERGGRTDQRGQTAPTDRGSPKKKDSDQRRLAHWTKFIELTEPQERRFALRVQTIFRAQEKDVLGRFDRATRSVKDEQYLFIDDMLFDRQDWNDRARRELQPLAQDAVRRGGQSALDDVVTGVTFDLNTERVQQFILANSERFTAQMNETTLEMLTAELQKGIEAGEGIPKLRKRIQSIFTDASNRRARLIARTEVIKSSNMGAEQAYLQSGVVQRKEWLAEMDDRVCSFCVEMNGKPMGLGETYWNEGDSMEVEGKIMKFDYEPIQYPPLHAQCRCTLIPIIEEF